MSTYPKLVGSGANGSQNTRSSVRPARDMLSSHFRIQNLSWNIIQFHKTADILNKSTQLTVCPYTRGPEFVIDCWAKFIQLLCIIFSPHPIAE